MWHWPQKKSFRSHNIFNPSSASYFQLEHYPILSLRCSCTSQSTAKPQLWLSLAQLSPSLFLAFLRPRLNFSYFRDRDWDRDLDESQNWDFSRLRPRLFHYDFWYSAKGEISTCCGKLKFIPRQVFFLNTQELEFDYEASDSKSRQNNNKQ